MRMGLRLRIRRAFGLLGLTRWVVERQGICNGIWAWDMHRETDTVGCVHDFRSKKSVRASDVVAIES